MSYLESQVLIKYTEDKERTPASKDSIIFTITMCVLCLFKK